MVITFSISQAREQLLDKGMVYTYRWTRRAFFRDGNGTIELTWANIRRGGKKMADVYIEEIGEMPCDESLIPYCEKSGFKNMAYWQWKILKQANPYGNIDGWLYRVGLQSSSGKVKK